MESVNKDICSAQKGELEFERYERKRIPDRSQCRSIQAYQVYQVYWKQLEFPRYLARSSRLHFEDLARILRTLPLLNGHLKFETTRINNKGLVEASIEVIFRREYNLYFRLEYSCASSQPHYDCFRRRTYVVIFSYAME